MLANWHFMRILRLVMGSVVVYQGMVTYQPMVSILGTVLVAQALLNAGCCGASCAPKEQAEQVNTSDTVEYEEVK